jgi:Na+/phosphate symporter
VIGQAAVGVGLLLLGVDVAGASAQPARAASTTAAIATAARFGFVFPIQGTLRGCEVFIQ